MLDSAKAAVASTLETTSKADHDASIALRVATTYVPELIAPLVPPPPRVDE